MKLLIVESPAKCKTIDRYLGKDYKTIASFGHVRDLPQKELGIDVDHNYEPKYVVLPKAKKQVSVIKEAAKKADEVYLATDLDREGEAIAWHLAQIIGDKKPLKRITFSEITKNALESALTHPRTINQDLVDAQQARRILDRIVGYKLSPLLWRKVAKRLSAGRVQSVAVRIIVDREREINAFVPQDFWQLVANLQKDNHTFTAQLTQIDGRKLEKFDLTEAQAQELTKTLAKSRFTVASLDEKEVRRNPYPPFTTSTLQQDAARKLGFSAKKTMMVAQQLYEGVELGEHGTTALITYMRTDSYNLSQGALEEIRAKINDTLGSEYLPAEARVYQNKSKGAQEAHEAIRPTYIDKEPEGIAPMLTKDQARLYELIWKRTLACQTQSAVLKQTAADIKADNTVFHATGSQVLFDGFLKIYEEGKDTAEEAQKMLPKLSLNDELQLLELNSEKHTTEPPARYSEATLVKKLEEEGIGRPSTYAPIMSTIQDRGYVTKVNRYFHPQDIGIVVNDLLTEHFPNIVDLNFTAHMEEDLDTVAEGNKKWETVIDEFYKPFIKQLDIKSKELKKSEIAVEETDIKCDKCGKPMVIRLGRYGKFLACSGFPTCKNIKNLDESNPNATVKEEIEETKELCPLCNSPMVVKRSRFGKFLACTKYPECKGTKNMDGSQKKEPEITELPCPECKEGKIVKRTTRRGKPFWGCTRYPKCKFATWDDPTASTTEKAA